MINQQKTAAEKDVDILEAQEADGTEATGEANTKESEAQDTEAPEVAVEPETEDVPAEESEQKYLRLMADFQNYKRRTEKEKSDIYAYANEKIVSELLDVIDNFERALAHGEGEEGFVQGMNNIFKIFKGVLEKSGLEEIEATGVAFDPNFHNAVMTEDSEEHESGLVTAVLQKGYKLNGKVIRPSMVKVAN
ncbi:nucleotide exchange factor GrpE [Aminipila butyrica]|uniref:Protein GrpE n=1 Tax=Aminipila butyrica TaxID=433296 RepID=A0A858BXX5_9FIRM|nr:nucleotide exchange factor GrpE [Aminipila butyrica]QIB69564.1 nucleotide exchange factor GrpE [Aminipila butyrica]